MLAVVLAALIAMPPATAWPKPVDDGDIMENLRATARYCYEIGRMTERMESDGIVLTAPMLQAIATGRAACFVEAK